MKQFLKQLLACFLIFYRVGLALGLFAGAVYLIWWSMRALGLYVLVPVFVWLAYLYPPYSNFLVLSAVLALLIGGAVWTVLSERANKRKDLLLRAEQDIQDTRDRAAADRLFPRLPQMYPQAGFQQAEDGSLFLPFYAKGRGLFWYRDQWAAITIGTDEDSQHILLSDTDDAPLEEQVCRVLEDIVAGRLVLVTAEDADGCLYNTDIHPPAEAEQLLARWGQPPEPPSLFSLCCHRLFLIKPVPPYRPPVGRILTWDGSGDKLIHFD